MSELQLRFDGGRQQRYFPERADVLACILRVSEHSPDPRFEIYTEGPAVRLADGTSAGRQFVLAEVVDVSEPGVRDALQQELDDLLGTPS